MHRAVVIIVDGALPRRRARPEGGPDHHHLRAAARVVLLLPLRAAARGQAAGARVHGDDRHPDDLPGPAAPAAVLRPRPRAQPGSSARSRRSPASPRSARWPTSRSSARLAGSPTEIELDVEPQYEKGKDVAASSGCLAATSSARTATTGPGPHLTEIGARLPRRRSSARCSTRRRRCRRTRRCARTSREKFDELVDFLASLK